VIEENLRVANNGLATTLWFNNAAEVRRTIGKVQSQNDHYAAALSEESNSNASMRLGKKSVPVPNKVVDNRVPIRLTRGPLDFGLPESKLPAQVAPRYQLNGDVRFERPNFIDGKKSISEIEKALVGEFGSEAVAGFDKFIEDLVTVGVAKWK
jgi:hypothetical protein